MLSALARLLAVLRYRYRLEAGRWQETQEMPVIKPLYP